MLRTAKLLLHTARTQTRFNGVSLSKNTLGWRWPRMWYSSTADVATSQPANEEKNVGGDGKKKTSLVIFDKDGTLICFHSMWSPWAKNLASRLDKATGRNISGKVFDVLGYCNETERVKPGLLAESTALIIRDELAKMLVKEGYSSGKAVTLINESWEEVDTSNPTTLRSLTDLTTLFRILKKNNVKIAICTADSRKGTESALEQLGIRDHVDKIVCGDDANTQPKPAAHNAYMICGDLGVDPSEAAMVGDTQADVGMGKAANLGKNIGVLSGVCESDHLSEDASHVIHSIKDILPLVLPSEVWKDCYIISPDDRILVEPHSLEEDTPDDRNGHIASEIFVERKVSLVIFDLCGTLVCTHDRWSPWVEKIIVQIARETHLDISKKVYKTLGMCEETQRVQKGVLGQGTMADVKQSLVELLKREGYYHEEAVMLVNRIMKKCQVSTSENIKTFDDLKSLFKTLKKNGVKVAVCTSDSREDTHDLLMNLGVRKYVDMMVCGDDPSSEPKPSAHNVKMICKELVVDPSETLVIGDSIGDLTMGKEANVKSKIGVLSGVGSQIELEPHADHIVPSIKHVIDHALETDSSSMGQIKSSKRLLHTSNHSSNPPSRKYHGIFSHQRRPFSTSTVSSFHITSDTPTYDYVILGAGSAGCVLANRLSADPDNKVLLLEAGPKDNTWSIHMPAALMYNLRDDKYNWFYHTEPESYMNNRKMYWPRGRVWGGSSSLNAMVYIRGHAYDYNRWEAQGANGWSYADCLPYFRKAQTHELGADDYRGGSGPLHVSRGKSKNPLYKAFIDAGMEAGYPFTEDMNGYQQEGVGWMDMTIHKGRRWNASSAYLRPVLYRENLDAQVGAFTSQILFDGNRAVGLEYEQSGQIKQVKANKEVILSGGSINSPQILMLSGVGNADDLKKLNIPVVAHLPGVGENLQDHLELYVQQQCTQPITLYTAQWKFPHNMIQIGLEWFTSSTGLGSTSHLESGGFVRSTEEEEHPNIQFHFLPSVVLDHGRKMGYCHAYQLHAGALRPESRGFLKLASKDPKKHPIVVANYLSTEFDRREMRDCVKVSREVFAQSAFAPFRGPELSPGNGVQTDVELDEFVRNNSDSAYHPSCTCKMGQASDKMAVVDSQTKVHGIEGLRVVDASIMPSVVSGNLNGPVIMMAEKASDIILGKTALPRADVPIWKPASSSTRTLSCHQPTAHTEKAAL